MLFYSSIYFNIFKELTAERPASKTSHNHLSFHWLPIHCPIHTAGWSTWYCLPDKRTVQVVYQHPKCWSNDVWSSLHQQRWKALWPRWCQRLHLCVLTTCCPELNNQRHDSQPNNGNFHQCRCHTDKHFHRRFDLCKCSCSRLSVLKQKRSWTISEVFPVKCFCRFSQTKDTASIISHVSCTGIAPELSSWPGPVHPKVSTVSQSHSQPVDADLRQPLSQIHSSNGEA